MRDRVLHNSVRALLPDADRIVHLVHMWSRHRLMLPYAVVAFAGMVLLAFAVGVEQWSGRIGLGLAGAATAAMATTEYRVLAQTTSGLVLLRSSRVRQKALAIIETLPHTTAIAPVTSNLVITDWSVGDAIYSVMKRHQAAMVAISQR